MTDAKTRVGAGAMYGTLAELDDWVRHTNAVSKVLGLKGAEAR